MSSSSVFLRSARPPPSSRRTQRQALNALAKGKHYRLANPVQQEGTKPFLLNPPSSRPDGMLPGFGSGSYEGRPSHLRRGLSSPSTTEQTKREEMGLEKLHSPNPSVSTLSIQKRASVRPIAPLPRKFQLYLRQGPPLSVADLGVPAPSLLPESRNVLNELMESRVARKGDGKTLLSPDTPFWRVKKTRRKPKNPITWGGMWSGIDSAEEKTTEEISKYYKHLQSSNDPLQGQGHQQEKPLIEPSVNLERNADDGATWLDNPHPKFGAMINLNLTPIQSEDGQSAEKKTAASTQPPPREEEAPLSAKTTPPEVAQKLLRGGRKNKRANVGSPEHGMSTVFFAEQTEENPENIIPGRSTDSGRTLIQKLRDSAASYSQTGVHPDVLDSLGAALKGGYYAGLERHQRRLELLQLDEKHDFISLLTAGQASVENCNLLVRSKVMSNDLKGALFLHDEMKLHGILPDADTYVSLIIGAGNQVGQVGKTDPCALARKFYLLMRENLISPTAKIFGSLMRVHGRHRQLGACKALLEKVEDEYPELLSVVHYTILIDAYVENGETGVAFEEFQRLRTWRGDCKDCKADEVLFTVMIKACGKEENAEKALNFFDDMRVEGLFPTDVTYVELIKACAGRGDFAFKCFELRAHMDAEDMPMSLEGYEGLLRACANAPSIVKAQEILREMEERRVELSESCWTELVRLYGNCCLGSVAMDEGLNPNWRSEKCKILPLKERLQHVRHCWLVVGEARKRGMQVREKFLNAIMEVYVKGEFEGYAIEMLQQFSVFGIRPDFDSYRILLEMFFMGKDTARFFALWDVMQESGVITRELSSYFLADDCEEGSCKEDALLCVEEKHNLPDRIFLRDGDLGPTTTLDLEEKTASSESNNSSENKVLHSDVLPLSLRQERVGLLFNRALEMALRTKSSKTTCQILSQMLATECVFPHSKLAERLARVGRHVLEIHSLVGDFVNLHKKVTFSKISRDQSLMEADIAEYKLRLAAEGRRAGQRTAMQEGRERNFITLKKKGIFRKVKLSKVEYKKHKAKGGEYWAIKKDRPKIGEKLEL